MTKIVKIKTKSTHYSYRSSRSHFCSCQKGSK